MQTCSNKYKVYKNGFKAREPYNIYDHLKNSKFSYLKEERHVFAITAHGIFLFLACLGIQWMQEIYFLVGHLEFIQLLPSTFSCKFKKMLC